MVDEALLSCVQGLPRLKHVEPLSQLLYPLFCMSSNVSAPIFETMFKSSGQLGGVKRLCVLWKERNARGLRPGSPTFRSMTEGLVMNRQPDKALKLNCSHADSEEFRPFINTVTYATVLSGFAFAKHDKEQLSAWWHRQFASIWLWSKRHLHSARCSICWCVSCCIHVLQRSWSELCAQPVNQHILRLADLVEHRRAS